MKWSRYNRIFHSPRFGWFLYNILSNTLIEVTRDRYDHLAGLEAGEAPGGLGDEPFVAMLRKHKVLVAPGEEEWELLERQYRRDAKCYNTALLDLTICPTLRCNFRCPYCFESCHGDRAFMSPETRGRLVEWIKTRKGVQQLQVSWYGGEPLLAFDVLCGLTRQLTSLGLGYADAVLVTNGYLLDRKKIDHLNDLMITRVQITLDGPADVHDSRRFLAGGGPTFARIMENLDALMCSGYAGACTIRVNVDRDNIDGYRPFRDSLLERYPGRNLNVYAGYVDTGHSRSSRPGNLLKFSRWNDFMLGLHHEHGIALPRDVFHPGRTVDNTCVATHRNGFVVGPGGELYKCWEDVGIPSMTVGNVHAEGGITNSDLLARYYAESDPYGDPRCWACDFLSLCGGGCAKKRMLTGLSGEMPFDLCRPDKERLRSYMEGYIEKLRTLGRCSSQSCPDTNAVMTRGWCVITPEVMAGDSHALAAPGTVTAGRD